MKKLAELKEHLACNIEGTAAWREQKSIEYPEDDRNVGAAKELYELANALRCVPNDDSLLETIDEEFAQAEDLDSYIGTESEILREIGFRRFYGGDARKFLQDVIFALLREVEPEKKRPSGIVL